MKLEKDDIVQVTEDHWSLDTGKCIRVEKHIPDQPDNKWCGRIFTKTDWCGANTRIYFDTSKVKKIC